MFLGERLPSNGVGKLLVGSARRLILSLGPMPAVRVGATLVKSGHGCYTTRGPVRTWGTDSRKGSVEF